MANHDRESSLPICQNCSTSTTPLWRRDEMGSVLCNACGLFLKLHGRPRPISLKTDVIKSRNRVKTSMRPDMMKKKNNVTAAAVAASMVGDPNGVVDLQSHAYAATAALSRRGPHKGADGHHLDGTDASMGGVGASGLYNTHTSSYPILDDGNYQGQHLPAFGDGSGHHDSSVNGDGGPQTADQLVATNSSLKTRVAELEVINDFITRRLGHYEPVYGSAANTVDGQDGSGQGSGDDLQLRSQIELLTQSERQLRSDLEEGHRRENMMKRLIEELEQKLTHTEQALAAYEGDRVKRPRLDSSAGADSAMSAASADAAVTSDAAFQTVSPRNESDATRDALAAAAESHTEASNSLPSVDVLLAHDAEAASTALAALTAATAEDVLDGPTSQEYVDTAAAVAAAVEEAAQAAAKAASAPSSPKQ
ncbi:GATA zinc finger protein 3 [Sporothrix epigloea]|uniref:GATA zinc finger protein 3 n=1 Tax=Sporothrix epigloea TaxID=1892477 RepID=A0ABP0DLX5_9PEZI